VGIFDVFVGLFLEGFNILSLARRRWSICWFVSERKRSGEKSFVDVSILHLSGRRKHPNAGPLFSIYWIMNSASSKVTAAVVSSRE